MGKLVFPHGFDLAYPCDRLVVDSIMTRGRSVAIAAVSTKTDCSRRLYIVTAAKKHT